MGSSPSVLPIVVTDEAEDEEFTMEDVVTFSVPDFEKVIRPVDEPGPEPEQPGLLWSIILYPIDFISSWFCPADDGQSSDELSKGHNSSSGSSSKDLQTPKLPKGAILSPCGHYVFYSQCIKEGIEFKSYLSQEPCPKCQKPLWFDVNSHTANMSNPAS